MERLLFCNGLVELVSITRCFLLGIWNWYMLWLHRGENGQSKEVTLTFGFVDREILFNIPLGGRSVFFFFFFLCRVVSFGIRTQVQLALISY